MKRLTLTLAAMLATFCCACFAATPLPPAPTNGYCSDGSNATGYFGVRSCPGSPPPPTGALLRASVRWMEHTQSVASNVDMTNWAQVWGRNSATAPVLPWPAAALNGTTITSTPQFVLPLTAFVCARFTVTDADPLLPGLTYGKSHKYGSSTYNTAGNYDVAISRTCGDFAPPSGCVKTAVGQYDTTAVIYRRGTGTNYVCGLELGDYYANFKWHGTPLDSSHNMCTNAGCKLAVVHN